MSLGNAQFMKVNMLSLFLKRRFCKRLGIVMYSGTVIKMYKRSDSQLLSRKVRIEIGVEEKCNIGCILEIYGVRV